MITKGGLSLLILCCFYGTVRVNGIDLDALARTFDVKYHVVRNGILMYGTVSYYANITMENKGTKPIPRTGWSLYFCHDTLIQPVYFNASTNQYTGGGLILSGNVTLSHIKGCMFKFEPYSGENSLYHFLPLQPGEKRNISFLCSNWAVSKFDMYPNIYLANDTHTSILENTKDPELSFVSPLTDYPQFMRSIPNDEDSVPYSPWERYNGYNFTSKADVKYKILPTPETVQESKSIKITLDNTWVFDVNGRKDLTEIVNFMQSKDTLFAGMKIANKKDGAQKVIQLSQNPNIAQLGEEGYTLETRPDANRVMVVGKTLAGVKNGVQSLLSLTALDSTIPVLKITDKPRFEYRGLQMDVARNFFNKDVIIKLLDIMAMYKLNKLQLNMADEEGWRVEIPGIPELTQIGGKRCHDLTETKCLFSQLGSDPSGTGIGSGFYSQQEYIDILKQANLRNIEVIPSINLANRARAAIVAMNAYSARTNDYSMSLMDVNDPPLYLSDSLYSDNAINPCMPSTYKFIEKIIKELKTYHQQADHPLRIFNIGGDDSPRSAWLNSSYCANLGIIDPDPWMRIKVNYTTTLANLASKYSVSLGAYEEFFVAFPTTDPLGGLLTPFSRSRFPSNIDIFVTTRNTQTDTLLKRAFVFANNSYNVILSPSNFFALDHVSEPNPNLPGDYWASRYINISKIFGYTPDNFCCNFLPDQFNYASPRGDQVENYGCLDDLYCDFPIDRTLVDKIYNNLKGMQAQVWTTKVRSPDHLFQLLFPRLVAFAERAWHKAPWEDTYKPRINLRLGFPRPALEQQEDDYVQMMSAIGHKENDRLEKMGVFMRVPPPGAKIISVPDQSKPGQIRKILMVDTAYPGLDAQVIGTNNVWSDIKPATDITAIKDMPVFSFRSRKDHFKDLLKKDQSLKSDDPRYVSLVESMENGPRKPLLRRLQEAGLWTNPRMQN